jgi:hypothetical protein
MALIIPNPKGAAKASVAAHERRALRGPVASTVVDAPCSLTG